MLKENRFSTMLPSHFIGNFQQRVSEIIRVVLGTAGLVRPIRGVCCLIDRIFYFILMFFEALYLLFTVVCFWFCSHCIKFFHWPDVMV
jgi:hypothetical protein